MNNNMDNKYDNESEQLTINIGDTLYYARIMPRLGIFDVYDLKVRTVEDTYFVAIDKRDKKSYLFSYKDVDKTVFANREDALSKVKEAEKHKSGNMGISCGTDRQLRALIKSYYTESNEEFEKKIRSLYE